MTILFIDFESQSPVDLVKHGLDRYVANRQTLPYCAGLKLDTDETHVWRMGEPIPARYFDAVRSGCRVIAHNFAFDRTLWNAVLPRWGYDVPEWTLEQSYCTALAARYHGLPGSLAGACAALALPVQKDTDGSVAMKCVMGDLAKTPASHPELFEIIYKYCRIDVDAMAELYYALPEVPERELRIMRTDARINERGIPMDVRAAKNMQVLADLEMEVLSQRVQETTRDSVEKVTQIERVKEQIKAAGYTVDALDKHAIVKLLSDDKFPVEFVPLLHAIEEASRKPKKPEAILRAHVNGRVRHHVKHYGAVPTGRWSGAGAGQLQSQNFARPRQDKTQADCDDILAAVVDGSAHAARWIADTHAPLLAALADAQRGLVCAPPGRRLVCADLSAIEGRVLPWFADDEEILSAIESGQDQYKVTASLMFGVPYAQVTKQQRQQAKTARLACQFAGGEGALQNMCVLYQLPPLPKEQATSVVESFRFGSPKLTRLWAMLELAAVYACDPYAHNVGTSIRAGRGLCSEITFIHDGTRLMVTLPSSRAMCYHNARVYCEDARAKPVVVYDSPDQGTVTLDRKQLSNNITQGLARDVFAETLLALDAEGYELVHGVHDEALIEADADKADATLTRLLSALKTVPDWAPGLPLDAEGWVRQRWGK